MAEVKSADIQRLVSQLPRNYKKSVPLHIWMCLPEDDPRVAEAADRLRRLEERAN